LVELLYVKRVTGIERIEVSGIKGLKCEFR